jgi:anti-sigma B factor antagonist
MGMSLTTREVKDVVIVDMAGRLAAGDGVTALRTTVRQLIDQGKRKFLLNLGDVSYIDSSALGELIHIYTSLRSLQGDVKLLNLTKTAKDLMQMTKLLTVFDTYDDEAKALSTFPGAAAAKS